MRCNCINFCHKWPKGVNLFLFQGLCVDDAQGQRRLGIQLLDWGCSLVISTLILTQHQKHKIRPWVKFRNLNLASVLMDMMPMLNQILGPGQNQTLVPGSWVSPGIWLKVPGNFYCPGTAHQLPFLIAVNQLPMFCRVINNKEASSSLCWLNNQPRVTFVTQGS